MPQMGRSRLQPMTGPSEPIPTGFDVFVLLLSILSIVNIVLAGLLLSSDVINVVLIMDGVMCLFLIADFLHRLYRAPSKRAYFFGGLGYLDLLGSLPVPGLRLFRIPRIIRVGRAVQHNGIRGFGRMAEADRAGNSLLAAVLLTFIVLQFGSMAIVRVEGGAEGSNIHTASDALWWSYVTITTVGYGDRYPVTTLGRSIGVGVLTVGVGLFGVLTAFIANVFLAPRRVRDRTGPHEAAELRRELEELRRLIMERQSPTPGSGEPDIGPPAGDAPPPDRRGARRLDHEHS